MATQLELQDADGNNLAMLAVRSGNMAILKAVMDEIRHTRVRKKVVAYASVGGQLRPVVLLPVLLSLANRWG